MQDANGDRYPPVPEALVHPASTVLVGNSAYGTYSVAPETIASVYGSNLAITPQQAPPESAPLALGGVTATMKDANGNLLPVGLFSFPRTR
jgi:hypothetical protein